MISPTGMGIRVDLEGDGHYGAKRRNRIHKGVDYLCHPFQDIVAPFDMVIDRMAIPNAVQRFSGIAWHTPTMEGKMFYFAPLGSLIGHPVKQGEFIGNAQNVQDHYGENMKPHIHFRVDSFDPDVLRKLTELVTKSGF